VPTFRRNHSDIHRTGSAGVGHGRHTLFARAICVQLFVVSS
jgi:hypothetical protein